MRLSLSKVADLGDVVGGADGWTASLDSAGQAVIAVRRGPSLEVRRHRNGRWTPPWRILSDVRDPHVQPTPEGRLLIVDGNSRRGSDGGAEENAVVFDAAGRASEGFVVGDGVEDVQLSSDGSVWVSYSNSGVSGDYGSWGWGRISQELWIDPVGYPGLVRFGLDGTSLLEFMPPRGFLAVSDCFALNAWRDCAWISYHPGFPIVRVHRSAASRAWASDLGPVTSLAVAADRVLLHQRIQGRSDRAWLATLDGGSLARIERLDLDLEGRLPLEAARWVRGRGPFLSAFTDTGWYRLQVRSG